MSGIGHNQGPSIAPGAGWRRYAWGKARADLLPKLPIEVLRGRIRRAKELGLDYKSYASIRATSGRDVIAFLFSSNALRIEPQAISMPASRAAKLGAIRYSGRLALVHAPLDPARVLAMNPELEGAARAPSLVQSWSETRDVVQAFTSAHGFAGDGVVLVGETPLEREWLAAGKLAGFVTAERYFQESVQ
ncbi:MAG: hypothetical protein KJN93_00680 [Alphaproteobacteria bacterium]|nr:hypothetical protein [Alphaproteobacteria bacterium]NNF23578.1 hypothetical protein [Paracoccaceae bacterium]